MKFYKNIRLILLIVLIILSLIAISPHPNADGVAIRSVAKDSAASLAGVPAPDPTIKPTARERIIAINNQPITDELSYFAAVETILSRGVNVSFTLQTNKDLYRLTTQPLYQEIELNETEIINITESVFNETSGEFENITQEVERPIIERTIIGVEDIGFSVFPAPKTNIRRGLDLSGGTRVILEPATPATPEEIDLIVENIKQRLNVFGLSDLVVRTAEDLDGSEFIIVEIAGANRDEVRELLSQQGKFEAKIANETVFRGGENDITYVCRTASCSGLDPQAGCGLTTATEWNCRFRYEISLSPQAAARQAAATDKLDVLYDQGGGYLSAPIELYLDDEFIDSLQIAADLKGRALTEIVISGSGTGTSRAEATQDALDNMRQLQTVMITGSLPVQLNIVKTDSISPLLGDEFLRNAIIAGILAMIGVIAIVAIRYREWKIAIPMSITMFSEAIIILGCASVINWNIDLAAIAAIIISIGTGVDDQIVIADETLRGETSEASLIWKERLARAFFIIMAAYITTVAAMMPLWFAGAGMLRGFALTTIIGVSIGVFVTRPAFGVIMEYLLNKDE